MNVSEEPHRLSSTTTNGMKGFRNLLGQNFVEQSMASKDFSDEDLDVNLEKSNIFIQGGSQSDDDHPKMAKRSIR